MKFEQVTVKKFVDLFEIINDKSLDAIGREAALLACLYDKEEDYFLSLPFPEFKKYSKSLDGFNLENIKPKAPKYLKANGKVYAPVYVFDKLTAGQLVDVMHFCKDPERIIENLTKILASISLPTKRGLTGRKLLSYGSIGHKVVAEDMEDVSIVDAYGIALFFWAVWGAFLESTGGYIVKTAIAMKAKTGAKLTAPEKAALLNILEVYGDGVTRSNRLQ